MNKKTLFIILSAALVLPSLAFAQFTIRGMVDSAVQVTLYIASGIVAILWIITGILFLTAQGAPEKLSTAKSSLIAAIIGTVLIIVAQGAMVLVGSMLGGGGYGGGSVGGPCQNSVMFSVNSSGYETGTYRVVGGATICCSASTYACQ